MTERQCRLWWLTNACQPRGEACHSPLCSLTGCGDPQVGGIVDGLYSELTEELVAAKPASRVSVLQIMRWEHGGVLQYQMWLA
jgi:hypothetical protein